MFVNLRLTLMQTISLSKKQTRKEGTSKVINVEKTLTGTLMQLASTTTVKAIYVRVFVSRHTVYCIQKPYRSTCNGLFAFIQLRAHWSDSPRQ